ncbi:MAG TPA: hypothetical protein VFU21_31720 [Kofleriaceae bacterium]|nr:hypothetical protein [Kofleriaceae bacterium]
MLLVRLLVVCALGTAGTRLAAADGYAELVRRGEARRARLAEEWARSGDRAALVGPTAEAIQEQVRRVARRWLGTPWGLGAPQSRSPGEGKINCGTFVGTVLRDAGFVVDVGRLQRQPSQLIIASFVGAGRTRKWSNAPMERFLADMRRMGPGLYIIGLDFHVGFLLQSEDELRFVHASYVTKTVVDEPAAVARPITESRYRVVGKLLDRANVRDWLEGNRIRVKGSW